MVRKNLTLFVTLFLTMFLFGTVNAQDSTSKEKPKDRPLEIKSKPPTQIPDCKQSSGIVRLKVTFDKSEKITNVEIASSSGCDDFDKSAIRVAKRIKFKVAIKDGEPVTVTKLIEYSFKIY
jgi:TonB family protein